MNRRLFAAICASVVALWAPGASAKIEKLTLAQMVAKAEGCVLGTIRAVEVQRIDHPTDGPDLFYTTLVIDGRSLYDGRGVRVPITFAGGVLPNGEGAWNAEAPSADDIRVGNQVVAFYSWTDDMGGGVAANALYSAHGGLFRVMKTRKGEFVLGRGEGYAIDVNRTTGELAQAISGLR
jgi:hypothetical protein